VSAHVRQAHFDAPVEAVWGLVGTPSRHPEWWPRVIEVRGERFDEGDQYAQVTKDPFKGKSESSFLLDRRTDLREIRMTCQLTGMYANWLLTPAQGGTFVEVEIGMQPRRLGDRVFDRALGQSYFRRWTSDSLDGLREALVREREAERTKGV
jgi:Polyketide cyclase / dehydrase and lipid transport